jgi:hypothetical protein
MMFRPSSLVIAGRQRLIFICVSAVLAGTPLPGQVPIAPPDTFQTDDSPVLVGFAPAATEPPVDAIREPEFYRTRFYIRRIPDYNQANHGPPDDVDDVLGTISGAYTDEGLYIYLEVIDDVVFVDSFDRPWEDDNIEILIDPDESRNGRFDGVNDSKYVVELKGNGAAEVVQGAFPEPAEGGDWSRFDSAFLETASGYEVEMFFPWEGLQVFPWGRWRTGIEVEINDDDGLGYRESWITLSSRDTPNLVTDQFATAELWDRRHAEVVPLGAADNQITIDGAKEAAYSGGLTYQTTGRPGIRGAPFETETAVTWTALNDDEALYFFFEVRDSAFLADSATSHRDDDSLELYLGGEEALRLALAPQTDGDVTISRPEEDLGEPAADGVEAEFLVTDEGWNLEVKVPFAAFGLSAIGPGSKLDFEFQLFDDDDGAEGEYALTWNAGVDASERADLWGTLTLLAPSEAEIPRTFEPIEIKNNQIDAAFALSPWREIARPVQAQSAPLPLPPNNVFGARWKALHDDAFLYLLVEVNDNQWQTDSGGSIEADDSLWVIFGGGLGGSAEPRNLSSMVLGIRPQQFGGVTVSLPDSPALDAFAADSWRSDLGYFVKARIPFAAMDITPGGNTSIGMDLRVFDDRDGGPVEFTRSWSSIETEWNETTALGRILLDPATLASRDGAVRYESGWYLSPWLGWFNENAHHRGWIYHQGFHWLFPNPAVSSPTVPDWYFSAGLNTWIYARESVFPNLWLADGRGWAYYTLFDPGIAFLYLRDSDTWIEL